MKKKKKKEGKKRRGISNEFVKALIDTEELCRRGTSEIIGRSRREAVTMSAEKHGRIGRETRRGRKKLYRGVVCVLWWWKEGVQKVGRKARSSLSASVASRNVSMRIIGSTDGLLGRGRSRFLLLDPNLTVDDRSCRVSHQTRRVAVNWTVFFLFSRFLRYIYLFCEYFYLLFFGRRDRVGVL